VLADTRARRRRDDGQATVELALATPVVCLLLLGVVQLAVVVRDYLSAIEIARIGARAAAVAADPAGAAESAVAVAARDQHARITASVTGDVVTVTATLAVPTDVPLIGMLLPDIDVSGSAAMVLEPP